MLRPSVQCRLYSGVHLAYLCCLYYHLGAVSIGYSISGRFDTRLVVRPTNKWTARLTKQVGNFYGAILCMYNGVIS